MVTAVDIYSRGSDYMNHDIMNNLCRSHIHTTEYN